MEAKFTKGKWSIFGDWGICKDGCEADLIGTFEPRGFGQKEGFANAHLIAAAPEMYEMLSDIRDAIAEDHWAKDIDNLLAKARGE